PEAAGDAEQLEGAALDGRGRGDDSEPWQALGGLDAVGGDGGQVVEQGGEAVHRPAVGGDLGGVLGQCRGRAAGGGGRAGAGGPGGDLLLVAAPGQAFLGDLDDEVLGDLLLVDHLAHGQGDGVLAVQRPAGPPRRGGDLVQPGLGGGQQLGALAGPAGFQERV